MPWLSWVASSMSFLELIYICTDEVSSVPVRETSFLGHVVGASTDLRKVVAARDWSTPYNDGELQNLLGLASYYRRQPTTSPTTTPLQALVIGLSKPAATGHPRDRRQQRGSRCSAVQGGRARWAGRHLLQPHPQLGTLSPSMTRGIATSLWPWTASPSGQRCMQFLTSWAPGQWDVLPFWCTKAAAQWTGMELRSVQSQKRPRQQLLHSQSDGPVQWNVLIALWPPSSPFWSAVDSRTGTHSSHSFLYPINQYVWLHIRWNCTLLANNGHLGSPFFLRENFINSW